MAYEIRLGYLSSAVLFWVLGVATAVILGLRKRAIESTVRWLAVTVPIGVLAEFVFGLVYNQRLG